MRKIILSTAAILSLVLSSCESKKTENTEVLTNKSEVVEQPVVSESDIANNLESSASTNSYMVLLDNGQEKKVALDPNETIISANNLPVNAQNFVSKNFGNMEFVNAIKEVDRNITTYNIQLKDGTKIEFTDNGDWTEVKNGLGKAIPIKFFPDGIQKYLQSKYPKIDAKSIEMDSKDKEIKVELLQNKVDLKFDLNGNFIKID
ncbi:PepSY-like domain-containing protein [Empedobacter tilapiae]|uniref:Putative beta-lactamase-inhibitor-like PepSY-like domain-containing protein n=1 Tax=Empedobacter tilapiae TaxID=2491114 RepID=A0A4Z1BQR1_9FLAO|nr:PepSY-like domain-containing protein [Empedobacter tilapiae]TGN27239.1 hypothetical protein E4J94_08490 [Empedobacter tilapiae]